MRFLVFISILISSVTSFGFEPWYEANCVEKDGKRECENYRHCLTEGQARGKIKGKDACLLKITCEQSGKSGLAERVAVCPPRGDGFCPEADACLLDPTLVLENKEDFTDRKFLIPSCQEQMGLVQAEAAPAASGTKPARSRTSAQ
jgi:hypothetical protein